MSENSLESKFIFVGNHRCLDFINTDIVVKGEPIDLLESFNDLVDWLKESQLLNPAEFKSELNVWSRNSEGQRAFEQAISFRTILLEMVKRIVEGKAVLQKTIDEINKLLKNRIGYPQILKADGKFEMKFRAESDEAIQLIVPIAEAASDLICNCDFSLIKKCENPECVLYFYDNSKNHARRWCNMNTCGNRIKVAAHYRRHKSIKDE